MITWTRHVCRALGLCLVIPLILSAPAGAATALAAPTKLTASVTVSSAALSWAKVTNAKGYRVCLQKSKAARTCYKTLRTTATKTSFKSLEPTDGTDYFFSITAERDKTTKKSALKGFDLTKPLARPAGAPSISLRTTASSVVFTWPEAAGATTYAACLLPNATATSCLRSSTRSAATTATFTGITPRPGVDYYYRVISYNAAGGTPTRTYSFDLPVTAVAGVTAKADGKQHIVLSWSPATNASRYAIQIATSKAMTTGLINAAASSASYTSAELKPGTTYYFRVRGLNDATAGAYSSVGELRFGTPGTKVRIVTYNLCGQDKCVTSGNKMKKWSTRKVPAGELVRSAGADIVATQESTTNDTNFGSQLPGFRLTHYKSAKSLFYKTSKYAEVSSGEITLSSPLKKYAVWADLRDIATGTRFIVVDLHLVAGKGKGNDDERTREMTALVNGVKKINPSGLPVIYAGDFNSNVDNANQSKYKGGYDAPLRSFKAAGAVDSFSVATSKVNPTWNSANQAKNPPLKHSHHTDHVYMSSDVRASSWKVLLRLSGSSYAVPFASDHNAVVVDLAVPGR